MPKKPPRETENGQELIDPQQQSLVGLGERLIAHWKQDHPEYYQRLIKEGGLELVHQQARELLHTTKNHAIQMVRSTGMSMYEAMSELSREYLFLPPGSLT